MRAFDFIKERVETWIHPGVPYIQNYSLLLF